MVNIMLPNDTNLVFCATMSMSEWKRRVTNWPCCTINLMPFIYFRVFSFTVADFGPARAWLAAALIDLDSGAGGTSHPDQRCPRRSGPEARSWSHRSLTTGTSLLCMIFRKVFFFFETKVQRFLFFVVVAFEFWCAVQMFNFASCGTYQPTIPTLNHYTL